MSNQTVVITDTKPRFEISTSSEDETVYPALMRKLDEVSHKIDNYLEMRRLEEPVFYNINKNLRDVHVSREDYAMIKRLQTQLSTSSTEEEVEDAMNSRVRIRVTEPDYYNINREIPTVEEVAKSLNDNIRLINAFINRYEISRAPAAWANANILRKTLEEYHDNLELYTLLKYQGEVLCDI